MAELRVYFHFRSPYSRIGLHHIARAGLEKKHALSLHVFTAPAGGAAFLNPTDSKPKLRYIMEDAPRMTMRAGLPIMPPLRPEPDYGAAIAAFHVAREYGAGLPFALAVSDARWGKAEDIADPDVLQTCAAQAGLPSGADLTAAPAGAMAADEAAVEQDGAFGVPFAVLDEGGSKQKFWGQDRFELLVELAG
ncbi:DsbA family protein [Parvularcula maris]|uniref:DsbA family protein n=1 Tax=Parvularcula maris TaxID=2965077 RepID=A0A9X2RG52_9PROT|nr:DsbA family protein [Parvularcula maris]MCQ8183765.1 DsbA family protein [Parvularcula maris]